MKVFIARQPVFDRERRVSAYELLFRNGLNNALDHVDGTAATARVMTSSALLFGIETLLGELPAFIKMTREALLNDYSQLFSANTLIPEIVDDVTDDPEVVAACANLKKAGYRIALGSVRQGEVGPLIEMADIVKVDFVAADTEERRALAQRFAGTGVQLVAKKVESYENFAQAMELGFDRFQGFFFAKPELLSQNTVQATNKVQYLTLLQRIHDPVLSFDDLHKVISQDVSLSYRLLRYLNSASFGFRADVKSIRHALILLGERGVKKWATLLSMILMGDSKPPELLATALTRAHFCEALAPIVKMSDRSQELFMMGLLSPIDALMDQPLSDCLGGVPIAEEIKSALLGAGGRYRDVLDLVVRYEMSDWKNLSRLVESMDVNPVEIPDAYLGAVQRSREVFGPGALQGSA